MRIVLVLAAVVSGACGGYDADKDCRESRACAASRGQSLPNSLESCVDASQAVYDNATDAQRKTIDDKITKCADLTGCNFVTCVSR